MSGCGVDPGNWAGCKAGQSSQSRHQSLRVEAFLPDAEGMPADRGQILVYGHWPRLEAVVAD